MERPLIGWSLSWILKRLTLWLVLPGWILVFGFPPAIASSSPLEPPSSPNPATLVGYAVLPPETFAAGPPSGQFNGAGIRAPKPRFPQQPVQGFSAIQPSPRSPGVYWLLSDNGFGTPANSPDYLLRLYELKPDPKTQRGGSGQVQVEGWVQLSDPHQQVPFLIVRETTPERWLTGADFDPESFVIAPDGSLWIGDEVGPYLLHFDANGILLDPPYPVPGFGVSSDPDQDWIRSPHHPLLRARPPQPGAASTATVPSSGGFESLALNPAGTRLYGILEKTVSQDPKGTLRIYEFDLLSRRFLNANRIYRLADPGFALGDMTVFSPDRYLVIERDPEQGEKAAVKKIVEITLSRTGSSGEVEQRDRVDLLNIEDPHQLAGMGTNFRFPFVTIENILVLDSSTLLVVNDNNYPATGGRGIDQKDATEWIWLQLRDPLDRTAPIKG